MKAFQTLRREVDGAKKPLIISCPSSSFRMIIFLAIALVASLAQVESSVVDQKSPSAASTNLSPSLLVPNIHSKHDASIRLEAQPNCTNAAAVSQNRLECFLWNLQVEIPDQSFKKDFITIQIHDMICTNFYIRGLESKYNPSQTAAALSKKPFPRLQVSVNQVEATCHGRYHATGGIAGDVQAHVVEQQQQQQRVEQQRSEGVNDFYDDIRNLQTKPKAMNVVFGLRPKSKASTKIPSKCTVEACGTHLTCQGIHFSGSMSAKLIQAFSKTVAKYITDALQTYICPKIIQQQATTLVTHFLQHPFHEFVDKYLPQTATATSNNKVVVSASAADGNTTNVFDYKMVRWALNTFNSIVQKHLQQGWIPLPPGSSDDGIHEEVTVSSLPGIVQGLPFDSPRNEHRQLPSDCQDMLRGISGWVKSIFGVRPRIKLPSYFHHIVLPISIQKSTVTVSISQVAIQGLDQMESLQILQPPERHHRRSLDNNTDSDLLRTNLTSSAGFFIVAPIVLNVTVPHKEPLVESVQLSLNVTRVEISFATALQVTNWSSTTMLQVVDAIQQFTDSFAKHHHGKPDWKALTCLIQTLDLIEVSDWITNVIVDSLQVSRAKSVDGSLEADLDATINTALHLFVHEYRELWSLLVKGVVQDLGTSKLNGFVQKWISEHSGRSSLNQGCPAPVLVENQSPKWVNFSKFELFNKLNRFFDNAKHMKTLNHFLRCTGETVELWSDWGASNGEIDVVGVNSILGQEQISIAKVETNHWDSLQKIQLLHPTGDKTLRSFVNLGNGGSDPPQAKVVVDLDGPRVSGQINLTVFLSLKASADTEVHYDLNRLENLTIDHFLRQGACGMLPLVDMRLLPNATSLRFGDKMGMNLTALINGNKVTMSSDNLPQVHSVGNQVLDISIEWLRSLFNNFVAELAGLSFEMCPGVVAQPDGSEDESHEKKWQFSSSLWCILAAIVVFQAGLFWMVGSNDNSQGTEYVGTSFDESELDLSQDTPSFFSSFQELIQPLTGTPTKSATGMRRVQTPNSLDRAILGDIYERMNDDDEHHHITLEEQLFQASDEEEQPTKSMFLSNGLPRVVLYSMPALIVATIILLVTSNVSVGASVDINIRLDDTILPVPSIFRFSLRNTIAELYRAGIYPLLLLVVLFSGIWPYVKLGWMLYAWMAPCDDQYERERRLLQLDALGKFSLVDSYVLILFVVAFRFHSEMSERLGIDVFVTPMYGFYSFLLATCLSLVLGHATVFFHRKTKRVIDADDDNAEIIESILDHVFEDRDGQTPKRLARIPQVFWTCSILFTLVMIVMGFAQESFVIAIGGLAGVALGEEYNGSAYSVVSLGAAIPESLQNPAWYSVAFLQGTYFFFTVVTPVMCLMVLLLLLVWPLTLRRQRCLLVLVEMSNAWSAIEVFLLSVLAAVLQISEFASFLVGDKCDQINSLAKMILDEEVLDTTCFTVNASVDSSCWYLVVGAILNSWLISVSLRFIHAAVEERSAGFSLRNEDTFLSQPHLPGNHGWQMMQRLMGIPVVGWLLFTSIENAPLPTEEVALLEETENVGVVEHDTPEPTEGDANTPDEDQ